MWLGGLFIQQERIQVFHLAYRGDSGIHFNYSIWMAPY